MAIQPYSQPTTYQLAYNDNVYVWKTGQATSTKRFQVLVTSPDGLQSYATLLVYPIAAPNQTITPDRAYVDLSRILQSLIGSDIEIAPASHDAFYANLNSHAEYRVIVKEQDVDSLGVYQTLQNWYIFEPKSVWNGVQDLDAWNDFDPADYLMDTGAGSHKFLTNGPTGSDFREIKSNQTAFLYGIGTENNAPKGYYLTTYDDYDGQGSQLSNIFVSNPNASTLSSSYKNRYFRVPCGTYDIPRTAPSLYSSGNPTTILNGVKSYVIRIWDSSFPISEQVGFNIDQECSKYDGVRLHWLNMLGGYDCMNFIQKSIESSTAKRKNYRQEHHSWTGTSWEYDKMSRGRTEYDIQLSKRIKVSTGYLSDSESVWMESLFSSPSIYEERSNELYAVNVDARSIVKQTTLNDKLIQYSFDLEYSLLNHRQRG